MSPLRYLQAKLQVTRQCMEVSLKISHWGHIRRTPICPPAPSIFVVVGRQLITPLHSMIPDPSLKLKPSAIIILSKDSYFHQKHFHLLQIISIRKCYLLNIDHQFPYPNTRYLLHSHYSEEFTQNNFNISNIKNIFNYILIPFF